ncbi:MAG: inorganic phosphate transporter [Erysipelotrichales bacterium]|nr:inorganic phosphate transporter [Erysipelotrichales bacterium]
MISINDFFRLCNEHPWAYVALLINFGVVFVNGYTDGPSAIATSVTTRAIKPRVAFLMCAIFNLLGTLTIGIFSSAISRFAGGDVSQTIANLVSWGNASTDQILCAIACGLAAIVIVSQICTRLGLPSSESNSLIGGVTGAGLALIVLGSGGTIGSGPWIKVIIGFIGSLIVGFILGFAFVKLIQLICRNMNKAKTTRFFNKGQIASSALMSYAHGIQDGGKFIGIFILITATLVASDKGSTTEAIIPTLAGTWWIYLPVGLVLFAGSAIGGTRILKTIGKGMANLKKYQAFATDLAAGLGLISATLLGLPLSTGSIKNTAIMGGGSARSFRRVRWKKAGEVIMWGALAFPISALVGFLATLIFIWLA